MGNVHPLQLVEAERQRLTEALRIEESGLADVVGPWRAMQGYISYASAAYRAARRSGASNVVYKDKDKSRHFGKIMVAYVLTTYCLVLMTDATLPCI